MDCLSVVSWRVRLSVRLTDLRLLYKVPRSMRNSPSGPTQFPESMMNQEEAVGFGHPPTGVQVYPTGGTL